MRRLTHHASTIAAIAAIALVAIALVGCGGEKSQARDATEGPERAFMMGISSLPRALNADAYADTFDLAAQHGEIVLIQRTPPWSDFVPGADISDATTQTTASEIEALHDKHLKLFFAIDPTDGAAGRDRLAGLDGSLAGKDFADPDVRAAFLAYAQYVALNYKPAYLALGAEMNLYYEKNSDDFENYRTLYDEAYDRVKAASPDTQVTVTFQYEDLQGMLPTEDKHFADWQLIKSFEEKSDVTAISTYPSFAFAHAADIPPNYYSQLRGFTDKPIVIAEMGYSSDTGAGGINNGTEQEQDAFVTRALADAQQLNMPAVIWFAAWDPDYAQDTSAAVFQHIGLLRPDGTEKPAWSTWAAAARRPYRPD